jgi:23S rRNA (cytosine1962-C5)-methyltransferase
MARVAMIRGSRVDSDGYELLYAGQGRRIERFGRYTLDRPCTTCSSPGVAPGLDVDARFTAEAPAGHRWSGGNVPRETWNVAVDGLTFELGLTETGQVGLFPEQLSQWRWIESRVRETAPGDVPSVLNLFAHTGGSTLAAARAGAAVVHVDASKAAASWARRNAGLSGLTEAPIRWIVDDAQAFVRRELRRGHRYEGVVLDPPTYGHGAKGQPWRLGHDLPDLLAHCAGLMRERGGFLLVTSHATGLDEEALRRLLGDALGGRGPGQGIESGRLAIEPGDGDVLPLGVFARWAG